MLGLSAFADEISPDLEEQIRICRLNGVTHFELRGVAGKNVLDFDADLRHQVRSRLKANGMGVISIGSPIGKVNIDGDFDQHFERFKIAVELAEYFESPMIRVFSYYPPAEDQPRSAWRDQVLKRFERKLDYIKSRPVVLIHENEKGIFGQNQAECLDLMRSFNSPKLRSAFDPANFVQAGDNVLQTWSALKEYTSHIHIKDAIRESGKVVPAGQGDGQIGPIIINAYASGYRGFLSLEPHLKVAGHSHGETGPELFKVAADALKELCRQGGVPLG